MDDDWVNEFLTPPFLPDTKGMEEAIHLDPNGNMGMATYVGQQAPQSPYGMQSPLVFIMPVPMSQQGQQMPSHMGSPMDNQMCNPMGGQWVLVPVESSVQEPA